MGTLAIIGLGSNLGDRLQNLQQATFLLGRLLGTKLMRASAVYETASIGSEGPAYYNACLEVETQLSPAALLGGCFGIEAAMGRERDPKNRNAPRTIDLDLLLYEGMRSDSYEMTLPHPRIVERAFVMQPLLDLFPEGRAPGLFFAPHLRDVGQQDVQRLEGLALLGSPAAE